MVRRNRHSGFTLLELILVMVIISIVMAMASPSLHGWRRAGALRDAGDELMAFTRMARTQAVTTCKTHRLCVTQDGSYYLMVLEGGQFVPVGSDFGHPPELPEGVRVALDKSQSTQQVQQAQQYRRYQQNQQYQQYQRYQPDLQPQENCVDFYPTGRTEVARFHVISDQAGVIEIACASPAEPFEVVSTGGGY
jgi:prepilin-type N-terminal cleavage/methylation domain-containing protein